MEEIPIPTNTASTFDEKPIGKSEFNMSEFPDEGEQPANETQTEYPMLQKLKSKAPKIRLSGLEDLLKMLTEDPENSDLAEVSIANLLK